MMCQTLKSKWQRVMTHMSSNESDRFKFTIRYPMSRVECCVPSVNIKGLSKICKEYTSYDGTFFIPVPIMYALCDCILQDLYEIAYAFSPDFNMDAFSLYVMIPRQFVPCTDTCIGELNFGLSPVFVIEEGTDVVSFLSSKPNEV